MAFDSHRGVVVFFGGEHHEQGQNNLFYSDTWEYDGVRWRQIAISGAIPTARDNHAMCYDTVNRRVLMVGGRDEDGLVNDAWFYTRSGDGPGVWQPMPYPSGGPGANFGLAFDESRGVALSAGGINADTDSHVLAYEWNGASWRPASALVMPTSDLAIAYDSLRGVIRIQGGTEHVEGDSDFVRLAMYDFAPGGWSLSPNWGTLGEQLLRYKHAMVYDRNRDRMVLFGGIQGNSGNADSLHAEYHPSFGWRQINPQFGVPARRDRHAMVYDSRRGVTVLYGGVGDITHDATFELRPVKPVITVPETNHFERCESESINLYMYVTAAFGSTYQWYHDGAPVAGATNTSLNLLSPIVSDSGFYFLTVADPCGNNIQGPVVRLVVHARPTITFFSTARIEMCPGASIGIRSEAESTLPIEFQWYGPQGPIAGATNHTLFLLDLKHTNTGSYLVEVRNRCGSVFSPGRHLQVGPSVLAHQQFVVAGVCKTALFSVDADGVGTLRYQWRLDGAKLSNDDYFSGVNGPTLEIRPCLYAHEGNYDCVVTDNCGPINAVTSRVAKLTISPGPEWVLRATNGPSARSGHAMAYDGARNVTVLFGGARTDGSGATVALGDLWEWNGVRWTQRLAHSSSNGWTYSGGTGWRLTYSGQPVARFKHSLAYDSLRRRTVLFGGETRAPDGSQVFLRDLWEWDGAAWSFRGTNGPAARVNAGMAFDAARGVTVMTGGFVQGGAPDPTPGAVWEWDGTTWQARVSSDGPSANYHQDIGGMAYDSFRHVVLFGPTVELDPSSRWTFRAWDGTIWKKVHDGFGAPFWGLQYGDLAYDSYRRRPVWFGGQFGAPSGVTGFFDGQNWEVLTNNPTPPAPRYNHAMAYDTNRHATVMFGGETAAQIFNGET